MSNKMINAAVLTISDTRKTASDVSGNKLTDLLLDFGADVASRRIVTDDLSEIAQSIAELADRDDIDLIITTGGTGFGPRDNTPEATLAVIERQAPGIAEAMRRETSDKTPTAMLSRAVCGIRGSTLIVNFPGSPKGVEECFEVLRPVLKHAIAMLAGDTGH